MIPARLWCILLLAPVSVANSASRDIRPVRVLVQAPDGAGKIAVVVTATPAPPGSAAVVRQPIEGPGEVTLGLQVGSLWEIGAETDGFWAAPAAVHPGGAQVDVVVTLKLLPTGTVKMRVQVPKPEAPPETLAVRFAPVPVRTLKKTSPEGTLRCLKASGATSAFTCTVPAGTFDLRLHAEGLAPSYLWGIGIEPGKTLDLGLVPLRAGASVFGRVQTGDGRPAATGCQVELTPPSAAEGFAAGDHLVRERVQSMAVETTTNERGYFQFLGVAPGTYALTASAPGMAPARLWPIEVKPGLETEVLDPLVLAAPGLVEVRLEPPLDPYGEPWTVTLLTQVGSGNNPASHRSEASREGVWKQSGLAPGRYSLAVSDQFGGRWLSEEVAVRSGEETLYRELSVLPIEGTVRRGNDPLSASLWFGGRAGTRRIRFDSDRDGAFAGYLPGEGEYPIEVVSENEGLRLVLDAIEVRRPEGKSTAEIEVVIPDTRLLGEVVDEAGNPVPAAELEITAFKDGKGRLRLPSDSRSDENGKFEVLGLPPGHLAVQARAEERASDWVEVMLPDDGEAVDLRLVVRRELELHGRVSGADGPVVGALVVAWPEIGGQPVARFVEESTDPDGRFRLRMPASSSTAGLLVMAGGYALRMMRVGVDPNAPLEIGVERHGGTLVVEMGRRVDEAGRALAVPWLVHDGAFFTPLLLQRWSRHLGIAQDRPDRLVLPDVESGEYALCAGPDATRALRRGGEPPAARCVSGFLAPGGELRLELAGVAEAR